MASFIVQDEFERVGALEGRLEPLPALTRKKASHLKSGRRQCVHGIRDLRSGWR